MASFIVRHIDNNDADMAFRHTMPFCQLPESHIVPPISANLPIHGAMHASSGVASVEIVPTYFSNLLQSTNSVVRSKHLC